MKLKIEELRVQSFVTAEKREQIQGGAYTDVSCGNYPTCALACSWTNGQFVCKQVTNGC